MGSGRAASAASESSDASRGCSLPSARTRRSMPSGKTISLLSSRWWASV